ncbi:hypothetical protein S7711_06326 [Stachybotrys chartarum IBT 7711]|uniref:RRM domain-containing protein n=1 Tax=Stachybotrys chartarum (strain CBS 109288 / IBT 7711) TaxID=1280523 RepID=A0A084AG51_STACB|nr:hypothetical protein S7711_06326 [Stachybotrys chartarum IBT 7711]KFA52914.1 hypothetical protein S40293_01026 [Stachybotrys chartarum IBT 40293]KFA75239.1 hypothetical protein S40288_00152 [Stachybotrys chartarum IBT 40288]
MAPYANDFEKLIHEGRERKKNEVLADRIFSRDRRQSAPTKLKPAAGGSLASRVGVKKQQRAARASLPSGNVPGNVNGDWTHDLHDTVNGHNTRASKSLGSRVTLPGSKRTAQRNSKLATALDTMDVDPQVQQQVNIVKPAPARPLGLTIKGLAGPFSVLAQNFAPGTTLADIESAMTPIGGEIISCSFVKTHPIMVVEMVFASREGGDRVIETFNDKTDKYPSTDIKLNLQADGRLIKVFPKPGGYQPPSSTSSNHPPSNAPNGPRASRGPNKTTNDQVVDGSQGFSDLIDTRPSSGSGARPLYSDQIVAGNRRGRGSQRGRGGGR